MFVFCKFIGGDVDVLLFDVVFKHCVLDLQQLEQFIHSNINKNLLLMFVFQAGSGNRFFLLI
jgi:hypothetical protein